MIIYNRIVIHLALTILQTAVKIIHQRAVCEDNTDRQVHRDYQQRRIWDTSSWCICTRSHTAECAMGATSTGQSIPCSCINATCYYKWAVHSPAKHTSRSFIQPAVIKCSRCISGSISQNIELTNVTADDHAVHRAIGRSLQRINFWMVFSHSCCGKVVCTLYSCVILFYV